MRRILLLTILFTTLLTFAVKAQTVVVNGTIADSTGKLLGGVNVTLIKQNGNILSFAISNNAGVYKLQYNGAFHKDSLKVTVSAAGYGQQSNRLAQAVETMHFKLKAVFTKLPNVAVKSRSMLRKEGDTLNYDVASFTSPQDRTIGDVIKKLPGVDVAENGQISYGGKPINRFYIDGDNLLDGKYNIATRAVPNDMVAKVQVLENHQPIKALKDVIPSDQAAMNIVLKPNARLKVITSGDFALGNPDVYNTTVNAMLFNKKVKFINYVKFNNSGNDISDEVTNHFGYENAPPPQLLSASTAGNPDLPKKRYLFNKVGLVNVNDMINLPNELVLRINAYYLFDRQLRSSTMNSAIFLSNDTIRYAEKQDSRLNTNTFNTTFTVTANKKSYYLNNVTTLENTPAATTSALETTTNNNVYQQLSGTTTNISNRLNYMKRSARDRIFEISSLVNNIRNPSTLQVWPGLYPQFNGGTGFAALVQQAAVPTFYTDNYLRVGNGGGVFRQSYKLGFNYQDQHLNSLLEAQQNSGSKVPVGDSFANRLNWTRFRTYLESEFVYKTDRTTIDVVVPFTMQDLRYTGRVVDNKFSNLIVTPSARISFVVGRESALNFYYAYRNNWSEISGAYDSYIMTNYRSFYTNSDLLGQNKINSYSAIYNFKNSIKIFFFTIGAAYSTNAANTMNDSRISSVLQQSKLILLENIAENGQLNGSISKYLFPLRTTLSAKASWSRSVANQLQNGDLLKVQNDSYLFNLATNTKLSSWFNFGYSGSFMTYNSHLIDNVHNQSSATPPVKKWQHELNADFNIGTDWLLRMSGQNSNVHLPGSSDRNFTFVDAFVTYKFNKLKTDIEFSLTNIANVRTYSNVALSANSIVENTWNIRPRMAMVKFYFRF